MVLGVFMSEEAPVWIENLCEIHQSVFFDGKRFDLQPFGRIAVGGALAQAFVKANPTTVKLLDEGDTPVIPGEDLVWVANVTGNPFLPKTVTVQRWDQKNERMQDKEIPNPKCVPVVIKESVRLSQEYIENPYTPGETISINKPPRQVIIPPYTRCPLSRTIAERLIVRDASRPVESKNSLVACPAPTGFEPNETWDLDSIRVYALLLGPSAGLSDEEIGIQPAKKYGSDQAAMEAGKTKLLNFMHFRLVDDRFRLPSKEEFDLKMDELRAAAKKAN